MLQSTIAVVFKTGLVIGQLADRFLHIHRHTPLAHTTQEAGVVASVEIFDGALLYLVRLTVLIRQAAAPFGL